MELENTQECFVQLWRLLERTRRLLGCQCKRFCIRNVLKTWFGFEASDNFIWEVCHQAVVDGEPQEGWNELPPPSLYPRKHRELLRAIVAVKTGISYYRIDLKALDAAYSTAFPKSTPINVNKKSLSPDPSPARPQVACYQRDARSREGSINSRKVRLIKYKSKL